MELTGPAATATKTRRINGNGSAVALFGVGVSRYRIRCGEGLGGGGHAREQAGTVRVTKDSGAVRLPREAPRNTIDADGRSYTLLYQNLLPELTITWPRAPQANSFVFRLQPQHGAARVNTAPLPRQAFRSGQLAEGTYRFWFEVDGDAMRKSPPTTLRIDFDNAAPAAQIRDPALDTSIEGAVALSGVAIEGARVSVSGADVPLDPQFRFRGEVESRAGEAALAIRIAHPKHGVHYYLRRGKR